MCDHDCDCDCEEQVEPHASTGYYIAQVIGYIVSAIVLIFLVIQIRACSEAEERRICAGSCTRAAVKTNIDPAPCVEACWTKAAERLSP